MTDIVTDMKRNIAAAGDALMYSPPLRTEQAREMVVIVESLREDKRSLSRIVDELSAQVNALNQTLQGVVMAQNAELLDQLGDALAYINAGCTETVTEGDGIEVQCD